MRATIDFSRRILSTLFGLILVSGPILADDLRFRHLTLRDGLPDTSIYQLHQDHLGFLWMGGSQGLVRWDGRSFQVYRSDPEDPGSLQGGMVRSLYEDEQNRLWIGTQTGGLHLYDRATDRFHRFRHDPEDPDSLGSDTVTAILVDSDGTLWVGAGVFSGEGAGLYRFSPDDESMTEGSFDSFRYDPEDPETSAFDLISGLVDDGKGALWISSRKGGLSRFDRKTERFTHYRHDPNDPESLGSDSVFSLLADRRGRIWAGTWGAGLDLYDPEIDGFLHAFPESQVMSIYQTRDDALWVGLRNEGLKRLDPESLEWTSYVHRSDDPESLPQSFGTWAILEDRAGILWMSVGGKGLAKVDPWSDRFQRLPFRVAESLHSGGILSFDDAGRNLWVAATTGLWTRSLDASDEWRNLFPGDAFRSVLSDRFGTVWAAPPDGLKRFVVGAKDAEDVFAPEDGFFKILAVDEEDRIWMHSVRDDLVEALDLTTGERRAKIPIGEVDIWSAAIFEGLLWCGTTTGMMRLDPERPEASYPPLLPQEVVFQIRPHRKSVWIGTFNGGLLELDAAGEVLRRVTMRDGLPSQTIRNFVIDERGVFWLATPAGLAMFDPRSGQVATYDPTEGLLEYRLNDIAQASDGRIFLVGDQGVSTAHPDDLAGNPYPPRVVFAEAQILNRPAKIGEGEPLARHISVAEEIRLSHEHKTVSFRVAALDFSRPELNRYAFRLDPLDETWNETGTRDWVNYSHLPPGEYVLRVKAAQRDGVWNESGASLRIVKRPPWWRTRWAMSAAVLALLLGMRLISDRRVREARMRAEMERTARELEEARELQLSMLPAALPDVPGMELAASMRTATEVGGDYYDAFARNDDSVLLALGDATGHGLRAGLMVSATKSLLNSLASDKDPIEILERTSKALRGMRAQNLLMALCLIRLREDELEFCNAGMPEMLIYRASTKEVEEIVVPGLPLGSALSFPYDAVRRRLESGDVAVFFSDGLIEARNASGDPIGTSRLLQTLRRIGRESAETIIERLLAEVDDWTGGREREDDQTILAVRRR